MKNTALLFVIFGIFLTTTALSQVHLTPLPEGNKLLSSGCPTGSENISPVNEIFEDEVIVLTNMERRKVGLPPLKKSDALTRSARYHSWDMCTTNYFNHNSMDSLGNIVCIPGTRVAAFYTYYAFGENIAAGQPTPNDVHTSWLNSPGHYVNMINTNFVEIGVGYYTCPSSIPKNRWDQNFGARLDFYPVIINNEAGTTNSRTVELYIYGNGPFSLMRLKNDGENWTEWQSFQTIIPNWVLKNATGTRTVFVEMKNPGGTARSSSDDIIYNGPGGLSENSYGGNLKAGYNPTTKQLIINTDLQAALICTYSLVDVNGRVVARVNKNTSMPFPGEHIILDAAGFQPGIYLLIEESKNMLRKAKVVIY